MRAPPIVRSVTDAGTLLLDAPGLAGDPVSLTLAPPPEGSAAREALEVYAFAVGWRPSDPGACRPSARLAFAAACFGASWDGVADPAGEEPEVYAGEVRAALLLAGVDADATIARLAVALVNRCGFGPRPVPVEPRPEDLPIPGGDAPFVREGTRLLQALAWTRKHWGKTEASLFALAGLRVRHDWLFYSAGRHTAGRLPRPGRPREVLAERYGIPVESWDEPAKEGIKPWAA